MKKRDLNNKGKIIILTKYFNILGVIYIYNVYIITLSYSNGTLCQNFKAIGEELSEITGHVQTNIYIFIYIDI